MYPHHDCRLHAPKWVVLDQNTVRHVLSTSQQFEKSRRPITEPGKGGYWSVSKTPPKSDSHRTRRMNRVVAKKEVVIPEPPAQPQQQQSPPAHHTPQPQPNTQSWAPQQQISVPVCDIFFSDHSTISYF
jgi:hypothetical protein